MKKNYTHISRLLTASVMLFLVSALTLLGQTPTTFQYQAVLRNADGTINADANVNIMLELHQGTEAGTVVYDETHSVTTSEFGMVNLEMGSITPATFATIDWAAGPYFVEVSVNGLSMGTSELLTVPYALYAVNGVPGPQGDQGIQGIQGIQGEPGLPGVIGANSVGSSHVIDNSLTVDDLDAGSVGSSEVVDNSLTADDLAPSSVGADEIATNAVGTAEIADGSIQAADIATNAVAAAEIAAGAVGTSEVADNSLTAADLATNSVGTAEIATGAVGSIEIATGTILNVDINANAEIAATKISGDAGIEYSSGLNSESWASGAYDTRSLASLTVSCPTGGYVMVTFSGYVRLDNVGRLVSAGIGTSATTMTNYTYMGYLSGGTAGLLFLPFSFTHVFPVTAGNHTFWALGEGSNTYTNGIFIMWYKSLTGVFIPKHY